MKKMFSVAISLLLVFSLVFCVTGQGFAEEVTGSAEVPFRISCVMNGDSQTQRGLTWYTRTCTDSLVEISDESAVITYDDVFEWEGYYCHKALVSALEPGTEYTYTVGSKNVRSNEGTFITDDGDDSVSFAVVADVQASSAENFEKGRATADAAFQTMPDAEFIVNLGDFTNESNNEEWDYYADSFDSEHLETTLVPVSGNHDGFNRDDWFTNMFNLDTSESVNTKTGVNYSFDYGNCHIAVLNTNDMISISLAQLKWLRNDMNLTDKDWKIVCMHKSPYTLGKDGKWPDAQYLSKSLTKVCDECDVDLVMSGHDHQYLRTKALTGNKLNSEGTTYVLAGTAGSKRYEIRSFLAGAFLDTDFINALVVQKNGYGNYWNGTDWNSTDEKNIGGCFNTVSIKGGNLTFNSYILSDELTNADGSRVVTNIDSFTLTKETGQNKATYSGDNTISTAEYNALLIPSFTAFAAYTFGEWLPKFLAIAPKIIYVYATEDTF